MNVRTVVVMLMVAALAVVLLVVAREKKQTGGGGVLPVHAIRFDVRDASELRISGQGDALELRRRPGNSDQWELIEGTTAVRADNALVEDFLSLLSKVRVADRMARAEMEDSKIAEFGLLEPSATAEVVLPGERLTLRFGKPALGRENFYAETDDADWVWLVSRDAYDQLVVLLTEGVRSRTVTAISSLDVKRLEIEHAGVTTHDVSRNDQQIWEVRHPYRGFAHPSQFERTLARIVNAIVLAFPDDDVQTPSQYGLDPPAYTVRLTQRRDSAKPVVLQMSAPREDGTAFVMEEGSAAVMQVGAEFVEAVTEDARNFRDPNFTRLGLDGVGIRVRIGGGGYELSKEGESWDIAAPTRDPADNQLVEAVLDDIRIWDVIEFRDQTKPESVGIDGEDVIEIERRGGEVIHLWLGDPVPGQVDEAGNPTAYFALREDDSGKFAVVVVPAGPIRQLGKGYAQYRSKTARVMRVSELEYLGREASEKSMRRDVNIVLEREFNGQMALPWRLGTGFSGELDPIAIGPFLNALKQIRVSRWIPSTTAHRMATGIESEPTPSTLRIELGFNDDAFPTPPYGATQVLLIGDATEDGEFHARFAGDKDWAFTLPKSFVDAVSQPLVKRRGVTVTPDEDDEAATPDGE